MDKLNEIFQRQAVYVRALTPTYLSNGFDWHHRPLPWDLSGRKAQEEFRLLAWRFTEELIEAQETYECHRHKGFPELYAEEMADALHFFVELCLASGILEHELLQGNTFDGIFLRQDSAVIEEPWANTIRALGLAMMSLRQRPWRTDYRETDRARWVLGMHLAFKAFARACTDTGITPDMLYIAYFRKSKVNDLRIEQYGVLPHGYTL